MKSSVLAAGLFLLMLAPACKEEPAVSDNPPRLFGPTSGYVNQPLTFQAWFENLAGLAVSYEFAWGDSGPATYTDTCPSGDTVTVHHAFASGGFYLVRARAQDPRGRRSPWSAPLEVSINDSSWLPGRSDTAAIDSVVRANCALLGSAFTETRMTAMDTTLSDTQWSRLRSELRGNPFKARFRCDSMQHLLVSDSTTLRSVFLITMDTSGVTATVSVAETLSGALRLHAYSCTRYLRDSVFVISPGETLRLPIYDTTFTDTSLTIDKEIRAVASNGCVLLKESGAWRLWKLAGGSRLYAPGPDDAPYISYLCLQSGTRTDTVYLRPDTLHYGIQRLFSVDSELLTYPVGDSIWVSTVLTTEYDAAGYVFLNHARHERSPRDKLAVEQAGIQRLFVEVIPIEVLYDMTRDCIATVWGIPFRTAP